MISKWVADGLVKHGIYDLLIELNDHPYLDSKVEYFTTKSTPYICQTVEVIDVNEPNTIGELKEKLERLCKEINLLLIFILFYRLLSYSIDYVYFILFYFFNIYSEFGLFRCRISNR